MLAGRLATAAPRVSVVLIEYGGRAVNPLLRMPKGFYYTLRGDRYLYRYRTRPVTPDGADEVWLRGRVLGGSAAVNGMMWMRGAQADWDGLAARGNRGWSWADVLPAYRAMENHSLGPSELRGAGGPLGVTVADAGDPVTAAILASAVRHGWEHVDGRQRVRRRADRVHPVHDQRRPPRHVLRRLRPPGPRPRPPARAAATSPSPPGPGSAACSSTAAAAAACGSSIAAGA